MRITGQNIRIKSFMELASGKVTDDCAVGMMNIADSPQMRKLELLVKL